MGLNRNLSKVPEVLTVSGSNVGINTTTPSRLLTVKGTSGQSNQGLEVLSPSGSRLGIIAGRGSNSPEDEKGYFQMTDTGTSRIVLDTSGSSYLNGGNVGLGTDTPTETLDVVGAVNISSALRSSGEIMLRRSGNELRLGSGVSADYSVMYTGGSEKMRITSGGLVGIGTDNPGYKLHNTGDTFSTAYTMNRGGGAWTLIPSSGESALYFRQDAGDSIKMTISGSGNVGIGTTSPQSLTHFYTSTARNIPSLGSAGGHLIIQTGGVIATIMGVNVNGNFYIQPQHINSGGSTVYNTLLNPSGGNVGVGTDSPSYKLEVVGGDISVGNNAWYRVRSTSGATQRVIGIDGGNNVYVGGIDAGISNVIFRTGGTERARLTSAGLQFQNGSSSLNYYEEGTFTPTAVSTNFSPATPLSGKYVRIGNQVTVTCTWSVAPGGTGKRYIVFNLPFAFVTGASFTGIVSNYDSGLSSYSSNVGTSVRNSSSSATQQYLEAVFTSNTVTNVHFLMTYFTF